MSDEKQNLDGKTPVKVVPFDAHERAQAASAAEYEHAEFPKAVDHVDHPSGVGKQPIVVHSPEDEAAYFEAAAAKAARETEGRTRDPRQRPRSSPISTSSKPLSTLNLPAHPFQEEIVWQA
jgi:hypothetical protein